MPPQSREGPSVGFVPDSHQRARDDGGFGGGASPEMRTGGLRPLAHNRTMSAVQTSRQGEARLLLGDEAIALAALDAGISGAFGYPGTPSTEIFETIQGWGGGVWAQWSAN